MVNLIDFTNGMLRQEIKIDNIELTFLLVALEEGFPEDHIGDHWIADHFDWKKGKWEVKNLPIGFRTILKDIMFELTWV